MAAQDSALDSTRRFSNRVDSYIRCRPGYPPELMACLKAEFGLAPCQSVGDIGSGTGISARLFLDAGCAVFAVEPNEAMRSAAEGELAAQPTFRSISGTAENTTLPAASLDWYVAAQAFHWFDVERSRTEALRILKPDGRVLLIWNDRRDDTPFLAAYERFLHAYGIDYAQVTHRNVLAEQRVPAFLGGDPVVREFANLQCFDFEGLQGRVASSSYMPAADHPRHAAMQRALRTLFEQHARGGQVEFGYTTRSFLGAMARPA